VIFGLIAFAAMLLNPLHLLYSAACMTDVPHAFIVLMSLWFALRQRWTAAAALAAIAGTIRVESWALLCLLPGLEFVDRRRIPWLRVCILLVPPAAWLLTSYLATGHPLSYFQERARYHAEYIRFHPDRIGFNWPTVLGDVEAWLLGANGLVTAGTLIAAVLLWKLVRACGLGVNKVVVVVTYWLAMLALLAVAYVSKAQPVLLPRYGLVFLAVGLPAFAWTLQRCLTRLEPKPVRIILVVGLLAAFAAELYAQLPTISNVQDDYRAHKKIALVLANALQDQQGVRCFSDDAAIRFMSGLPVTRFVRSPAIPDADAENGDRFLRYLRANKVGWLVFFPTEDSLPMKFFPEMAGVPPPRTPQFEFVDYASSAYGPDVWLYRIK
jgi:hypothetical protein